MNGPGSSTEEFFDAEAARYDREYDSATAGARVLRARLGAVLELLGAGPGRVLDAGMGSGRLCVELDRREWEVSGIDASAEMVGIARTRLPHLAQRLLRADVEELPFPDETFDAVVATGVLEYADLGRALHEVARVLGAGGTAVVSIPSRRAAHNLWRLGVLYPAIRTVKAVVPFGRSAPPRRERLPSPAAFVTTLERAGLVVEDTRHVGARPAPGSVRARQLVYKTRKHG